MAKAKRPAPSRSPKSKPDSKESKISRLEELQSLTDAEVKERYIATFAKDPEEGMTTEIMINSINDAAPNPPPPQIEPEEDEEAEGLVYGNKDSKKQYAFDPTWKNKVVVRQVRINTDNGGMYEVPNTDELQTYDKRQYETMLKNNFFGESKMKVDVLHMPAK